MARMYRAAAVVVVNVVLWYAIMLVRDGWIATHPGP